MRRFLRAVCLCAVCLLAVCLLAVCLLAVGGEARAQSGIGAPQPLSPIAAPTPAPIGLAAYGALLDDIEHDLLSVPRPDALLPWMQGRLALVKEIALPSGGVIAPVNLLRNAASAEEALARIDALQGQLAMAGRDRLAERQAIVAGVVNQRVYREGFNLWDKVGEWLERAWRWLFPDGRNPFATAEADAVFEDAWDLAIRIVAVLGGIGVALLLGWWGARLWRNFVRDTELQRRRAAGDEMPATAAEARAIAAEQARTGSFRQAVRSMYLSALLALEEAEIVVHDRTLTNRELLVRAGAMEAGGEIRPAMLPVVQGFDDVWYGVLEPDAATYAAYERHIAALNRRIAETREERQRAEARARETGNRFGSRLGSGVKR